MGGVLTIKFSSSINVHNFNVEKGAFWIWSSVYIWNAVQLTGYMRLTIIFKKDFVNNVSVKKRDFVNNL